MRIHAETLTLSDIQTAAKLAQVDLHTSSRHGSQKRDHAFEIILRGNSRRRPNVGSYGAADDYAATWDQWGVFLGKLFELDPEILLNGTEDHERFEYRTNGRFSDPDSFEHSLSHDHRFQYAGVPREQECVGKHGCGAVQRWGY